MKNILRGLLLALPLLTVPAQAHANGSVTFTYGGGCKGWSFNCTHDCLRPGGCGCLDWSYSGLGPWYSYWPYDNHFTTPAHPEFPYWPQAMGPVMPHAPAAPAAYYPTTGVYQPVSYPSYWYGR